MSIEISILCPSKHCRKCKRMISIVENTVEEIGVNAEIKFVSEIAEMQKFNTWILPSLFINSKVIARGFIHKKEYLVTEINKFLNFE